MSTTFTRSTAIRPTTTERSTRRGRTLSALAILALARPVFVDAHRADEYLQAARISIERERVEIEIELTPGILVADRVLTVLDPDGNGSISEEEARAYAGPLIAALSLVLDGSSLGFDVVSVRPADPRAFRDGLGSLLVTVVSRPAARPVPGSHQLRFRNGFTPEASVYLANAMLPNDARVAIVAQTRDALQREITIDYILAPARPWIRWVAIAAIPPALLGLAVVVRRLAAGSG